MIFKVVSSLEKTMYELHKCHMTLKDYLLVMYDIQSSITIGDALNFLVC
jgi:hypothetical protein